MNIIKIEVSKKESKAGKNVYAKVGEVDAFVPTLEEVGVGVAPEVAVDDKGAEVLEDGLPVYKDPRHNFILDCILAAVKAKARNKLVSGTATLKAGLSIAATLEALMAEGDRVGNPDALAAIREAKTDFAAWVATLGKSTAAQNTLNTLFSNKGALGLQNAENKAKMTQYVTDFAESLDAPKLERYTKYLDSVIAAAEVSVAVDDF